MAREALFEHQADALRSIGFSGNKEWSRWEDGKVVPSPVYMVKFVDANPDLTLDFIFSGRIRGLGRQLALKLLERHPELLRQDPDVGDESNSPEPPLISKSPKRIKK